MRVVHIPQGLNPYDKQGVDRTPCWPMAKESVTVGIAVDTAWDAKLNLSVNSKSCTVQGVEIKKANGLTYYSFDLGSFDRDDEVTYWVDEDNSWSFEVLTMQRLDVAQAITLVRGAVCVNLDGLANLYLRFDDGRLILSQQEDVANGKLLVDDRSYIYQDEKSSAKVAITLEPFAMTVTAPNGREVARDLQLAVKTYKGTIREIIYDYHTHCSAVYGLGERYCHVNHKGSKLDCLVFDKFTNQGAATYYPIPMFHADNGHGLYFDTTCLSYYDFGSEVEGAFSITVRADHRGQMPNVYMFFGTTRDIIASYTELTGKPVLPPKWTFGVWASANRWDRQERIEEQLRYMDEHDYPTSVVVIEAWSDEATFYTWNDATYEMNDGSEYPKLEDMTFGGRWPDPKGMIDELHRRGIKVILWQIPVLSELEEGRECQQHMNDREYAVANDLCVKRSDGTPYQTPNPWFCRSFLPDFTNEAMCKWWAGKRQYLLDMGVDGFKSDGGEFVFHDDVQVSDGRTGREMRNGFTPTYLKLYHDFIGKDRVLFSRAGYTETKGYPMHWAGDQMSTFGELRSQLRAGLSLGLSGSPYWTFDIGGFAGVLPSAELYIRATEMAALSPVLQWHSDLVSGQYNDLVPSAGGINDRSPWNMQSFTGDENVIPITTQYAKLHMQLMPFIYSEAHKCTEQGMPMMRHLILDYPDNACARGIEDQYMMGGLLVAPIVEESATQREVYLPEGKWLDLGTMEDIEGGRTVVADAPIGKIPVYLRHGDALILQGEGDKSYDIYIAGSQGSYAYYDENGQRFDIHWQDGKLDEIASDGQITLCKMSKPLL